MPDDSVVFIIDDDAAIRDSLSWLVESVGLRVKTFANAGEFLAAYEPSLLGCIVLDVRMPGLSGLDLQEELNRRGSDLPVLIITGYGEVQGAVRALKAGAADYLQKPVSDQTLLDRIQDCLRANIRERKKRAGQADIVARMAKLTRRQRQVMDLVVAGRSNKEIARCLDISVKTVESHRGHVMQKMGVSTIADLVRLALITVDD